MSLKKFSVELPFNPGDTVIYNAGQRFAEGVVEKIEICASQKETTIKVKIQGRRSWISADQVFQDTETAYEAFLKQLKSETAKVKG